MYILSPKNCENLLRSKAISVKQLAMSSTPWHDGMGGGGFVLHEQYMGFRRISLYTANSILFTYFWAEVDFGQQISHNSYYKVGDGESL